MIRISHSTGIVTTAAELPFSKSLANRALVIRFLSGHSFPILNLPDADDTQVLLHLFENMPHEMHAADAGTAYRFLAAALSITPGEWILSGSSRLMERPILPLVESLQSLGAGIRERSGGGFNITGKKLKGGHVCVDSTLSSQFVSALLLIAPCLENGLVLQMSGSTASWPYISMTLRLMEYFGVKHERNGSLISIQPQDYASKEYAVERDWSAASYWYEIAALASSAEILLKGLSPDSLQGDAVVAHLMEPLGVSTTRNHDGMFLAKHSSSGKLFTADCRDCPDLAPALITTAAAQGRKATFTGLENLNEKESRRQDVLCRELASIGAGISGTRGSIDLNGGKIRAQVRMRVHNDHRMAMCFAPLSLVCGSVELDEPSVASKSYRGYWNELEKAGFRISEL